MSDNAVKGELFILSAPSGAGKTTLIHRVMNRGLEDLAFSVSHTTRRPREGEVEGREYHFVAHAAFREMIADDSFLEWAEVHGNLYGTSWRQVVSRLHQGIDVLLDIDVQGAEKVLQRFPEAHSIFVLPPSFDALEERLRRRSLDSEADIARRLAGALREIERYDRYRYVIINDDADRAGDVLAAILLEKRHLRDRMRSRVQSILQDFQARISP